VNAVLVTLRNGWRRLTSMRTAVILLFLLALAAVPGSLLPQRPLNPAKVQTYLQTHGAWGTLLDRIGAFDVFGSVWFAAVYLLLAISLIGCLIPRIRVYARAVRAQPLKAPRVLSRLAESGSFRTGLDPAEAARLAGSRLRPRWRTVIRTEDSGAVTVSAEKGYLREAGNLVFHVCLLVALVLIALGRLFSYQGSVLLTEGGAGFCNPLLYDSFHAGRLVDISNVSEFCVDLDSFTATYRSDNTPSQFKAVVTYQRDGRGLGPDRQDTITVNHPLRLEGDRVYLINHGFAPTVTVTRPGQKPITDTAPFLPQDGFLTSEGVFKELGPAGGKTDIGLQGVFAPTPQDVGGVVSSIAPQAQNPELALIAFVGDTGVNNGLPQSVYTLDTSKMKQVAAQNLLVGQTMKLPDGTTVRFDGYKQWASLQVSHDPTQGYLLVAAVLMVAGLLGSLSIRRRRVWLRLTSASTAPSAAESGRSTLVEVGGLARNDSGNFTAEFETLLATLRDVLAATDGTPSADEQPSSTTVGAGAGKD
jgi:cytochrome c biogenesis protein